VIEITTSGAGNLAKWLDATNARSRKALYTATRVEGFRLMRLLRQEIKQGDPGGRPFTPLSVIAASRRGRHGDRTPLRRLAAIIRYTATNDEVRVGFVQPARGGRMSASWRRIAQIHQEGFRHGMDDATRQNILRQLKYAEPGIAKYFALKKSTQRFHTPARPIVEPFWSAHRTEALANIRANFRRKIAGDRI
jgi:hypothetical protein